MNGLDESVFPDASVPPTSVVSPDRSGLPYQGEAGTAALNLRRWAEAVANRYAPAYVVVDQDGLVLLRSERLDRFVIPSHGSTTAHLAGMICDDLRGVLRHLLDRAALGLTPVRTNRVAYVTHESDGSVAQGRVDLVVESMPRDVGQPAHFMVLFLDGDDGTDEANTGGLAAQGAASAAAALATSQELFRLMASIVPAFLFTTGIDGTVSDMNEPFFQYTGLPEDGFLAGGWPSVIHPDDLAEYRRLWLATAQQGGEFRQEHRLRAADGSWRWFLSRSVPQHDAQGRVVRWFGSSVDIQQRRSDERRQRLLLAEVQHRAKNILAVVRSLLSRTLETAVDLDDFAAHLSGRISALARTQSALGRTIDGQVGLEELAHQEVVAHGGQLRDQVSIEGPIVMLTDKVAEILGLALHELTTNALKFGALSHPDGRVNITWSARTSDLEPGGGTRLALVWEETGMVLTQPAPPHSGFGRELIERGLPYELGATTELKFRADGVRCVIAVTLKAPPEGGPFASGAA